MTKLARLKQELVAVAMGRAPAEIVVRQGRWVCAQSGEVIPDTDVAIIDGHVAYVGPDAQHCIGPQTRLIECRQKYIVPGLLDGHMHVESGMVTLTEFVRAVARRGTTGIFIDPHEIANVFGLRGIRLMVDEARKQPIHVWIQIPSCVPAAPGLETSGASIGPAEVTEAMQWPGVIGLGEMMDFTGVCQGDRKKLKEMAIAHDAGKTVGGHFASPDLGFLFHGYAAAGAEDDHEGTRIQDAVARLRQGMKPMLRYGSAAHDLAAQVGAITKEGLDPRHFILCTDDSHAQTLASDGHMDRVVRHAIREGLEPMTAIQMATINTAEHFGVSRHVGMIAPGRWADLVLVEDLTEFAPALVIAKGRVVGEAGALTIDIPIYKYPAWAKRSVRFKSIKPEDLALRSPSGGSALMANVIGVSENQLKTQHLQMEVVPQEGEVRADTARDLAKLALIQRHDGMAGTTLALVHGFGFKGRCAAATTIAHDCHQLLIVGTDDACMAKAANELRKSGGGQVVVKDDRVIGLVDLTIAGLMSSERVEVVAAKAARLLECFRDCGCTLNNPNVLLSFLALTVIPELRVSDKGLIDVTQPALIPVLEKR